MVCLYARLWGKLNYGWANIDTQGTRRTVAGEARTKALAYGGASRKAAENGINRSYQDVAQTPLDIAQSPKVTVNRIWVRSEERRVRRDCKVRAKSALKWVRHRTCMFESGALLGLRVMCDFRESSTSPGQETQKSQSSSPPITGLGPRLSQPHKVRTGEERNLQASNESFAVEGETCCTLP